MSRDNHRDHEYPYLTPKRKFRLCTRLKSHTLDDLTFECRLCDRLLAACCNHDSFQGERAKDTCHNCSIVMTDGACSNNGRYGATSGLGIVMGDSQEFRWSIPVDDSIDGGAPHTSQRAELLAALQGLRKLGKEERSQGRWKTHACRLTKDHVESQSPPVLVVVTDSQYVVKGMSEWFPNWRWSISVDDTVDANAFRTSQRAELLAAIEGLKKLHETDRDSQSLSSSKHEPSQLRRHGREESRKFAVATDSEYTVKGITEWLPAWRKNGWRNAQGKQPANLDLFLKLDEVVTSVEATGILVGFWHIPREMNALADDLAKEGTRIQKNL